MEYKIRTDDVNIQKTPKAKSEMQNETEEMLDFKLKPQDNEESAEFKIKDNLEASENELNIKEDTEKQNEQPANITINMNHTNSSNKTQDAQKNKITNEEKNLSSILPKENIGLKIPLANIKVNDEFLKKIKSDNKENKEQKKGSSDIKISSDKQKQIQPIQTPKKNIQITKINTIAIKSHKKTEHENIEEKKVKSIAEDLEPIIHPDTTATTLPCKNILIFKKTPLETQIIANILNTFNGIQQCKDFEEFKQALIDTHFNLVIFDYRGEDMDLLSISNLLKKSEEHPKGKTKSIMFVEAKYSLNTFQINLFDKTIQSLINKSELERIVRSQIK